MLIYWLRASPYLLRHASGGWHPRFCSTAQWIPACAGMTVVGILCLFFVMPEEAGIHASESVSITLINRYSMEQALLVATVDVGRPRSLSDYAECYCAAGRAANVFVAGKGTSEGAAVSVNHPGYGKNVEKQGSVVNN